MTFDQIQALPTEPAALRDWIVNALAHSDRPDERGPADRERPGTGAAPVPGLAGVHPAGAARRSGRRRSAAIAAYPGVRDLGAVPGGRGLLLPGDERLVVDPATGRVNGTSTFVTSDGATYHSADPAGATISAEWTDNLPK